MSRVHELQLPERPGASPPAPGQERLDALLRQVAEARGALAAWHEGVARHAAAHLRTCAPLERELAAVRRQWTFALDALLDLPDWSVAERAALRELAFESAADLLSGVAVGADPQLAALRERHAGARADSASGRGRRASAAADAAGDAGDADATDAAPAAWADDDPDRRRREAQAAREAAQRQRRRDAAARRGREEEAQRAGPSLREVFRRVAGAVHPDRETDPARREARTALMQEVNRARADGDLLALLELQGRVAPAAAGHPAGAGRLQDHAEALAAQLARLRAERDAAEARWRGDFGLPPGRGTNPARLEPLVRHAARWLRDAIGLHRRELRTFADRAATRRWLKAGTARLHGPLPSGDDPA